MSDKSSELAERIECVVRYLTSMDGNHIASFALSDTQWVQTDLEARLEAANSELDLLRGPVTERRFPTVTILATRFKNLIFIERELAEAQQALSEAAREIHCAGPVAHRIRVFKKETSEHIAKVERERDEARGRLDKIAKLLHADIVPGISGDLKMTIRRLATGGE